MSVADCRSSRRKMRLRYGHAHKRSVTEAMDEERRRAQRQAAINMTKRARTK